MNNSNRRIKGLGEVSIRVKDLDAMHKFYEEVIGLEVQGGTRVLCSSKSGGLVSYCGRFYPLRLCTLVHIIKAYELRMGS